MPTRLSNNYLIQMSLCGLLLGLSAPGINGWWLAWLALIPALFATARLDDKKRIFSGGFLLGFLYSGIYCLWFFDLHPLAWLGFSNIESRLVTLAGWLLLAAEGGLITGLLMRLYRYLPAGWARMILFPVLWVFGFALLNCTPMALPWAYLEYTQAGLWPMRWLAEWISGSGITALIVLYNTAWAEALSARGIRNRKQWLAAAIVPIILAGLQALPPPKANNPPWPIPIAIVQANLPIEVIRSGKLDLKVIEPAYIKPIRNLHLPAGTLLVYPEEGVVPGWVPIEQPYFNPMMLRLALLAWEKRIYIAVGISSIDAQNHRYNSIALLSPDLPTVQYYHKRRLVPFGETTPYGFGKALTDLLASLNVDYSTPYDAGEKSPLLYAGQAKIGGLICFELIDSAPIMGGYAQQYRKQGANLLINTSNLGWFHQNPLLESQFLAIAQLRAAETHLPLVVSSNTGISAILSPEGAILQRTVPNVEHGQQKSKIVFYNEGK
jgi:apolipoprotein N-acyltransferase